MQHEPVSLLRLHPAGRGLSEEEIGAIAEYSRIRTYGPGEELIRKGSLPGSVALVIGGRLRMCDSTHSKTRLAIFGPGDLVGLLMLLQDETSSFSVVADEQSMTLEIDGPDMIQLMRVYPLLA